MKNDFFLINEEIDSNLIIKGRLNKKPQVSIMIPTFKRPKMLLEAVSSACLQRTKINYEIIIIDNDPSEIEGRQIESLIRSLNDKRISLYRNNQNIGLFGNWNRCIKLANAEWLTILNDDDLLNPNWLESMYSFINKKLNIAALGCSVAAYGKNDYFLRYINNLIEFGLFQQVKFLKEKDYFISCPHSGSLGILINKKKAIQIGGFDPEFYPCADYLFFSRLCVKYNVVIIRKTLALYRKYWSADSKSEKNLSGTADVLFKTLHQNWIIQHKLIKKGKLFNFILLYYMKLFSLQTVNYLRQHLKNDLRVKSFFEEKSISLKNRTFMYIVLKLFIRFFN